MVLTCVSGIILSVLCCVLGLKEFVFVLGIIVFVGLKTSIEQATAEGGVAKEAAKDADDYKFSTTIQEWVIYFNRRIPDDNEVAHRYICSTGIMSGQVNG